MKQISTKKQRKWMAIGWIAYLSAVTFVCQFLIFGKDGLHIGLSVLIGTSCTLGGSFAALLASPYGQEDEEILVQSRRDKKAAEKFFRKLLTGLRYVPRLIITDKLKSDRAAKAEVLPSVEHCQQKYQNNRAENSHQPTRLRERVMRRFKSSGTRNAFYLRSALFPPTSDQGGTSVPPVSIEK
jgi:DDE domain